MAAISDVLKNMKTLKTLTGLLALVVLLAPWRTAMADEPPTPVASGLAGAKDCRFAIPSGWNQFNLKWEGGCVAGKADGRGALRATVKGTVTVNRIFFGSMAAGELSLGVIDTSGEGYVAGKFKNGRVIDTDERSEIIKAFDEASAAAKVVSERFKKIGKTSSASFYEDKAKKLAEQMD
jgi:hypothetical protein